MEKVEKFIKNLEREKGLAVLVMPEISGEITDLLGQAGFVLANDWQNTVFSLDSGRKTAINLTGEFNKERYEIIIQYISRPGTIEIIDPKTMKELRADFDPNKSMLLAIVLEKDLKQVEANYHILENSDLAERA